MKKLLIIAFIAVIFSGCNSKNNSVNDGDITIPDETVDENGDLPDNNEIIPDENDDAVEDTEQTEQNYDAAEVDSDNELIDTDDSVDEDNAFYAEKCDCYGSDYTIPEQFRGIEGWCKQDADGDTITNCIEAKDGALTNSDDDADPDYIDTDSDNDGIPDSVEGVGDIDEDGISNFRDTDSDGDGYLDSEESPDLPSRDTDGDGLPDYVDFDSDNDGLLDKDELDLGTNPLVEDTDGDGFDDLAEVEFGTDPLDDQSGIPEDDFYVKLPYNAAADEVRTLKFKTSVEKADILIFVDLSGSMGGEIGNLKTGITSKIIDGISANITDVGFGLATFDDWKALNGDEIFKLVQPVTTNKTVIADAVNALNRQSNCGWEPHHEALYQAASGAGYSGHFTFTRRESSVNACDVTGEYYPSIPAADCTTAEGNIGGACFRTDAMPIIIMMSDEGFTSYPADVFTWTIPYHTTTDATDALNAINAKFIGVDSWDEAMTWTPAPEADFKAVSMATGSVDATTGEPFFYKIASDGTGLSDQISDAVLELTSNIKLDVWTDKTSVDNPLLINTSLFIKSLTPDSSDPVNAYESKDLVKFDKVSPGAKVNFEIKFYNDIYEPTKAEATVFRAKINVLGDGALLDTREVVILVPGIHSRDATEL